MIIDLQNINMTKLKVKNKHFFQQKTKHLTAMMGFLYKNIKYTLKIIFLNGTL